MFKNILTFCFAVVLATAWPAEGVEPPREIETQKIKNVAIFPLRNISGDFDALNTLTPMLEERLKQEGFKVIPYRKLDRFLTEKRIRDTSFIDRITAIQLWRELGADAILLGSIDLYSKASNEVYAGLTLRLVGSRDCSIIWANTLSYAGSDFTGILGFGKIRSIEELSKKIIDGVMDEIPGEYIFDLKSINAFELERVRIYPPVTGGGQTVRLLVGVVPVLGEPSVVQVRINEQIFDLLEDSEENYFSGEIISPAMDGSFPVEVIIKGSEGESSRFLSAGDVVVDMVPPKVSMQISKKAMRGLKQKDYILFTVKSDESVKKWEVEILNKDNKYVRGGKGYNSLPARLIWRGENDGGGINKDGTYTFRLLVWDAAGNVGVHEEKVRLDTTPPVVNIEAESVEDENEMIFSIDYDQEEVMDKWDFSLYDDKSKLIKKMSGNGNIDRRLVIPVVHEIGKESGSRFIYSFNAIDSAGNTFKDSNYVVFLAKKDGRQFTQKQKKDVEGFWFVEDF